MFVYCMFLVAANATEKETRDTTPFKAALIKLASLFFNSLIKETT